MELAILVIALTAVIFAVQLAARNRPLAATASDWFVVFDVDAENKVLGLWFYPVIAFERRDGQTIPVTSSPEYTRKLTNNRPAKKVNDTAWGVSVSYGRWVRDGAFYDQTGNPDYLDTSNFASLIQNYMLGEFRLHHATAVPVFYEDQINAAVARTHQVA